MKEVVLITGANGMLAQELAESLNRDYQVRFLTRKPSGKNEFQWDIDNQYIDPKAFVDVQHIIHLAGASIAGKRWTKKRKRGIINSRLNSSLLIQKELKKRKTVISSFISASAIGYYGTITTDAIFDEKSPKGNDFLSNVCSEWENAAHAFDSSNIVDRTAIVRIGIVLAKNKGVLKKIIQPMKYGIGTGIGTGNQYLPWIHIRDLVSIFKFILDNKRISGTFNAVSPQHVRNIELTKAIAELINKPLFLPNIPKWIIQLLFGEMSILLLEGSRISSDKIRKTGFKFEYKKLSEALKSLID